MKILIVCIQGLTSGILARRMTALSREHGDGHEFRACSQFDLEQYQSWADVILMTTQVKSIAKTVEERYHDKKVLLISEEAMSFNQVEETYAQILRRIATQRKTKFTWEIAFHIFANALLICTFLCLPGWLSWLLFKMTGIEILKGIYESTTKIICLYGACITGYCYASKMDESKIAYMLIGVMSLLAISPGLDIGSVSLLNQQATLIPLPNYGYLQLFLYIPCVIFFLFCYQKITAFIKDHIYRKNIVLGEFDLGFFTISGTAEIFILLLFRMLTVFLY